MLKTFKLHPVYRFIPDDRIITFMLAGICIACALFLYRNRHRDIPTIAITKEEISGDAAISDYIKWMSFDVPTQVMAQALAYDLDSYNDEVHLHWIELIAYGSAKGWGKFDKNKKSSHIDKAVLQLKNGVEMNELTTDLKLYDFYLQAYTAVLGGFVGEYEVLEEDTVKTVRKYGLKAFSPVAQGYYYSHYEDFGVSRTYGYRRKHQGNDLMGNVGIPIIAIEDGYIESIGWNQYGGWRVGIRSYDKKRYYYYAHLRKDHPYPKTLAEGDRVQAGDVIGYLGMTGYSATENKNNIKTPHLHLGLQIIFDESQKEGSNQIWVDVYNLVDFLSRNKMPVTQIPETRDYVPSIKLRTIPED